LKVANLKASTTYQFKIQLLATSSVLNACGVKLGFSFPAGSSGDWLWWASINAGQNANEGVGDLSAGVAAYTPVSGTESSVFITGYVDVGTTEGTLNLQVAQNSANATALVVEEGSTMTATEVT
jgi:hypothetical protein